MCLPQPFCRVPSQEGGCAYKREGVPTSTIPSRSFTRKYKSICVRGRVCLPQPFHRVPSQGSTNLSVSEGGCASLNHSVAFLHKEVQIYLCQREGVPTSTIPSRSFTRTYKSTCVRGRACLPQPFHRVPSQGRTNLSVSEGGCASLNHSVAFLHKEVQIYLCEREGVPTSTIPSRSFTRTYNR